MYSHGTIAVFECSQVVVVFRDLLIEFVGTCSGIFLETFLIAGNSSAMLARGEVRFFSLATRQRCSPMALTKGELRLLSCVSALVVGYTSLTTLNLVEIILYLVLFPFYLGKHVNLYR
jgi:hypothetical protein